MKYQDCVVSAQAIRDGDTAAAPGLTDANINPATGLATDYLNHFNEAIMLLDMLSSCPDCRDDLLAWSPLSYREHFAASHFKGRDVAIAAYDAADPTLRAGLDTLARTMIAVLEATRVALGSGMPPDAAGDLAIRATASLKLLVAQAAAVINGDIDATPHDAPQAVVDGLMKR